MEELAKLTAALERFYAQARTAQEAADDATARQLQSMIDQIRQGHAQLAQEYAKSVDGLHQQIDQAKQAAAEAKQKAAAARAQHAAAQAAAKKPPAPPAEKPQEPIDPQLGQQVRQQLLQWYFGGGKHRDTMRDSGELWRELIDWQKPGP